MTTDQPATSRRARAKQVAAVLRRVQSPRLRAWLHRLLMNGEYHVAASAAQHAALRRRPGQPTANPLSLPEGGS